MQNGDEVLPKNSTDLLFFLLFFVCLWLFEKSSFRYFDNCLDDIY